MLNCPACRAEVAELEQAVHVLKMGLSPQNNASYESITVPVMKLIHEQQQTGERRWFGMPSSGYLPLASVAIIVVV
ncbi:MAG TPA: hypothetical protein DHW02_05040, partial [Ktedonobacter sp.]|nr:hypothetical protein [Ktedonobacter sp.]